MAPCNLGRRGTKYAESMHDLNTVNLSKVPFFFVCWNIIVNIICSSRFAASIPAEEGSGGGGVSDTLAKEVVQTCELIVQEAGSARQNQGHVQRLKQLAQQVADLMQHPQAYGLTREAETREMVNNLKEVLGDARMIVWYSQQPQRSMIPLPLISCSGGRGRGVEQPAEQILTVVYKMEYYLQVLPVMARRQMVIPESEYGAQAS